jgi:hypothetical protein
MAPATRKSTDRLRILRLIIGGLLLGLGILTVGYSVWAFTTGRAYLDEVEASGQAVEAFDAANYLMTSSGLYLLVGVLLAALGGLYLTRRIGSVDKDSPSDHQGNPAVSTTSKSAQPSTHTRQASAPAEEDELDELLRRVDDQPEPTSHTK